MTLSFSGERQRVEWMDFIWGVRRRFINSPLEPLWPNSQVALKANSVRARASKESYLQKIRFANGV